MLTHSGEKSFQFITKTKFSEIEDQWYLGLNYLTWPTYIH